MDCVKLGVVLGYCVGCGYGSEIPPKGNLIDALEKASDHSPDKNAENSNTLRSPPNSSVSKTIYSNDLSPITFRQAVRSPLTSPEDSTATFFPMDEPAHKRKKMATPEEQLADIFERIQKENWTGTDQFRGELWKALTIITKKVADIVYTEGFSLESFDPKATLSGELEMLAKIRCLDDDQADFIISMKFDPYEECDEEDPYQQLLEELNCPRPHSELHSTDAYSEDLKAALLRSIDYLWEIINNIEEHNLQRKE